MAKIYNPKTFKAKSLDITGLPESHIARQSRNAIYIQVSVGWNWISFPYKGLSTAIEDILPSVTYPQFTKIKTSGFGAVLASQKIGGVWVGSLLLIDPKKGYQLYNDSGDIVELIIDTPNGYGSLYGDADLKWDLAGGLNLVSTPFFDPYNPAMRGDGNYYSELYQNEGIMYVPLDEALDFTNHDQPISGGTGEILEGIIGDSSATDYVDNNWVGAIADEGLRYNGSYYFDVKNQPSSEPFRYFSDPTPHPYNYSSTAFYPSWRSHPVDDDGSSSYRGNFLWTTGGGIKQNFHAGTMFYEWEKQGAIQTLTKPTANEDWIGCFRGEICVGSWFIVCDDWTHNTNGSMISWGSNLAWCVSLQSAETDWGTTVAHNCYNGDLVRYLYYKASTNEYFMCKWYDTTIERVLEYTDPLGDGSADDVSKYMFSSTMLSGQVNDTDYKISGDSYLDNDENALMFNGSGGSHWAMPLFARFALVAIPWIGNTWESTTQ